MKYLAPSFYFPAACLFFPGEYTGNVYRFMDARDGFKVACIRRSLTRAFKQHGFDGVTPHGLRKKFCSMLARQKVHPKVAQTLMGHSDISLTMRVYTEIDDDQLKEAVNRDPHSKLRQ